jgi:hypothetical protein
VDAVFPHAPADHNNKVAGTSPFLGKVGVVVLSRDYPDSTREYEGLSSISVVKPAPALRCGNAGTIPPDTNAADDTVKDLAGREDGILSVFSPE